MALMVTAFPTSGSLETASRLGIITALMVGTSSTVHLIKVREQSRAREASVGRRLHLAVKYGMDSSGNLAGEPVPDLDGEANGDAASDPGEGGS